MQIRKAVIQPAVENPYRKKQPRGLSFYAAFFSESIVFANLASSSALRWLFVGLRNRLNSARIKSFISFSFFDNSLFDQGKYVGKMKT